MNRRNRRNKWEQTDFYKKLEQLRNEAFKESYTHPKSHYQREFEKTSDWKAYKKVDPFASEEMEDLAWEDYSQQFDDDKGNDPYLNQQYYSPEQDWVRKQREWDRNQLEYNRNYYDPKKNDSDMEDEMDEMDEQYIESELHWIPNSKMFREHKDYQREKLKGKLGAKREKRKKQYLSDVKIRNIPNPNKDAFDDEIIGLLNKMSLKQEVDEEDIEEELVKIFGMFNLEPTDTKVTAMSNQLMEISGFDTGYF